MTATTLTDLQRAIRDIQVAAIDAAAEHPNDPLLMRFWQKLNDFGEKVDTWREQAESEAGR
jgi:hypothetical protein